MTKKHKELLIKIISITTFIPVYIIFMIGVLVYAIVLPVPQIFIMKFLENEKSKENFLKRFYRSYVNNVTGLFEQIFRL
jgi:hypothetical protein